MNNEIITPRVLLGGVFVGLAVIATIFFKAFLFSNFTITFCDVGQGDGAYVRTKTGVDIVIDAGPDGKILECLGKKMPFYDRTIELAFISHPQLDHFGGFTEILKRYTVKRLIATPIMGTAPQYKELLSTIKKRAVPIESLYAGDTIQIDPDTSITFLWPQKLFLSTIVKKMKPEDWVRYESDTDPNLFSEIFILKYKTFQTLFTGDATTDTFDALLSKYTCDYKDKIQNSFFCFHNSVDILKVPHHGSKNALNKKFISLINPSISVISVAKKNRYGHPSPEVLDYFRANHKSYYLTSQRGAISVILKDTQMIIVK